jgi:hypothetical protein
VHHRQPIEHAARSTGTSEHDTHQNDTSENDQSRAHKHGYYQLDEEEKRREQR